MSDGSQLHDPDMSSSKKCCAVTGSVGGLSLGLNYVRAHYIGIPEINISVISTTMLGMCLLVVLFTTLVQRWEDNFDSMPWKSLQHSAKTRLICPFTGKLDACISVERASAITSGSQTIPEQNFAA